MKLRFIKDEDKEKRIEELLAGSDEEEMYQKNEWKEKAEKD